MIQKINTQPSFKGVYPDPSVRNMSKENIEKIETCLPTVEYLYADKDCFLAKTNKDKDELVISVERANKFNIYSDPDIAARMPIDSQDLWYLASIMSGIKTEHEKTWGKKGSLITTIKDIDKLDDMELMVKIHEAMMDFEKKFPEIKS